MVAAGKIALRKRRVQDEVHAQISDFEDGEEAEYPSTQIECHHIERFLQWRVAR